ncbi:MAG: hypothetical protein ACREMY_10575, partial [bacterium]
ALPRLNRYVRGVFGYEMGEMLYDWPVPAPLRTAPQAANYPQAPYPASTDMNVLSFPLATDASLSITPYPPKNSRLVWGGLADLKVYFPEQPDDGSRMGLTISSKADSTKVLTLDANGRLIEGAATAVQPTPVVGKEWLYRADLGDWKRVADMLIDDECPFPDTHDDLWICLLAVRLAPRYNKQISAETQAIAAAAMKRFKTQYRQTQNTVYGSFDTPRSLQSYISGQWWW